MPPYLNETAFDNLDMIGLFGRLVLDGDGTNEGDDNGDNNNRSPIPLPLTGVNVEANIVDFIGEVKLTQCYHNTQKHPVETIYHFPIDQSASVCELVAEYDDGTRVEGLIKEKQQARNEYNQAVSSGKQAQLLESVKRDILTLKMGNLLPGQYVKISVTYITTLKAQEDAIAFVLPTCIAPRYTPPNSNALSSLTTTIGGAAAGLKKAEGDTIDVDDEVAEVVEAVAPPYTSTIKLFGLNIDIKFNCHSKIKAIDCPTHQHTGGTDNDDTTTTLFTSRHIDGKSASVSFKDIAMDRDLVVLVTEDQPHQPRACIEIDDSTLGKNKKMTGFVTLFPQIEFPDTMDQEFIFIVDRSGSMGWGGGNGGGRKSQIQQAGDALLLLLRSLPPSCTFNIVGFGSRYSKLFDTPQPYNDETLEIASNYAVTMKSNMGGTVLKIPLEHILQSPQNLNKNGNRQVFILTDGQVSNDKEVFDVITKYCNNNNDNAGSVNKDNTNAIIKNNTRVFALGIGNGVSRHLVEGMARAGRGTAKFVEGGDSNSLRIKVLGQLKQAMQPSLDDVTIEWKFATAKKTPVTASKVVEKPAAVAPVKTLLGYKSPSVVDEQQPPPTTAPRLFPSQPPPVFNREKFLSFAFFEGNEIPESVTIKCNSPDGPLEVCLPISKEEDVYYGSFARKMAARTAISEYEDNSSSARANTAAVLSKSEALRLALENKLVSEQTSFVAIMEKPVVETGAMPTKVTIPQYLPGYDNIKRGAGECKDRGQMTSWRQSRQSCSAMRRSSCKEKKLSSPVGLSGGIRGGRGGGGGGGRGGGSSRSPWMVGYMDVGAAMPAAAACDWNRSPANKLPMMMDMDDVEEVTRGVGGGFSGASPAPAPFIGGMFTPTRAKGYVGSAGGAAFKAAKKKKPPLRAKANKAPLSPPPPKIIDPLLRLCVLQKANGSFVLNNDLAVAIGMSSLEGLRKQMTMKMPELYQLKKSEIIATLLAVATMRSKYASNKDVWELQNVKAATYLISQELSDVDDYVTKIINSTLLLSP